MRETGIEADIEFKTKGFISGTYDAIDGYIKDSKTSENRYHITGKWNEVMEIKDLKTGKKSSIRYTKTIPAKPKVRSLDEQGEYESRRLWKPTVDALAKRDHTVATDEKFKIEDEQRDLAKIRRRS